MPTTTDHKEKLVSHAKDVVSDSENLIKATASDVVDKAKDARDELTSKFEDSKSKLVEWSQDLKEQAAEKLHDTDKVIRKNPYQSLGIAFATGLILGAVLNRR